MRKRGWEQRQYAVLVQESFFADMPKSKKLEAQWRRRYRELAAYKQKHGSFLLLKRSTNKSLYDWVRSQREVYRSGKMSDDRIEMLDKLDLSFRSKRMIARDRAWNMKFNQLKSYKRQHGHVRVRPALNKQLYGWTFHQRSYHTKGKLSSERLKQLQTLGFFDTYKEIDDDKNQSSNQSENERASGDESENEMSVSGTKHPQQETYDRKWKERFEILRDFKQKYGHAKITQRSPGMRGMYCWLYDQRSLHSKGSLRSDKFEALDSIGVFDDYEFSRDSSGEARSHSRDKENATLVSPSAVSNGSLRLTGIDDSAERSSKLADRNPQRDRDEGMDADDHSRHVDSVHHQGGDNNDHSYQAESVSRHDDTEGMDADDHSYHGGSVHHHDRSQGVDTDDQSFRENDPGAEIVPPRELFEARQSSGVEIAAAREPADSSPGSVLLNHKTYNDTMRNSNSHIQMLTVENDELSRDVENLRNLIKLLGGGFLILILLFLAVCVAAIMK